MEFTTEDYLKKALLDTQEKVRDFQNYSQIIEDPQISLVFKEYAEQEAMQARRFNHLLNKSNRTELGEREVTRRDEETHHSNKKGH